MAKPTLAQITASPLDYLYIFAPDSFLQQLGSKVGNIIYKKKKNQEKLLNTLAVQNGSTLSDYAAAISQAIQTSFGMTPAQILIALAQGKNVAGKDWSAGVYGVGDPLYDKLTTYVGDYSVSVGSNGKIVNSSTGAALPGQTAIYATDATGKTYLQGYAATQNGTIFTSLRDSNGGAFYANTVGTATSQTYASGKKYDQSKAASVWEAILTYAPYAMQIIQWIVSLFTGGQTTLITAANTVPSQEEFTYNSGISSNELLLLVGGGAALYALTK